jgi:hypothetical protein
MDKKHYYTTINGVDIEIRAVSIMEMNLAEAGLRAEYLARGEPLDPPTYRVDLAGGGYQEFPHDETTLRTDEEKAAWEKHQEALARYTAETNRLRGEIMLEDGIAFELPKDTRWIEKQKRRHIQIPDEPDKLRQHYLETELLKTPEDAQNIVIAILKLSARGAADPAAVEAAMDGFRRGLPTNRKEPAEKPIQPDGEAKPVEAHHAIE